MPKVYILPSYIRTKKTSEISGLENNVQILIIDVSCRDNRAMLFLAREDQNYRLG